MVMAGDDRPVSDDERTRILRTYFDGPCLVQMPARAWRKRVVLEHVATRFSLCDTYTEQEVNTVLGQVHPDFCGLRRYLIDYGLLARTRDGSSYWREQQ